MRAERLQSLPRLTDAQIVDIAVEAGAGEIGIAAIACRALQRGLEPRQIARNWDAILARLATYADADRKVA